MTDQDRVAIVTGGGAGIGKACSLKLAELGYKVLIGDFAPADGEAVRDQIISSGGQAHFSQGDVSDEAASRAWAEEAIAKWGRIDVLIGNAAARVSGDLLDSTEADWEKILGVNLKGAAYSCKAVLPQMIEQQSGAIVLVSSANALVGRAGMPLYDATKAAVLSLARSLAVTHGSDGIRVNAVCPGFTMTDYHERLAHKRGVSPEALRADHQGYALLGRPAEPHDLPVNDQLEVPPEQRMERVRHPHPGRAGLSDQLRRLALLGPGARGRRAGGPGGTAGRAAGQRRHRHHPPAGASTASRSCSPRTRAPPAAAA